MDKLQINKGYLIGVNIGSFIGIVLKEDKDSITMRSTGFFSCGKTIILMKNKIEWIKLR